ncbi:hypothetical protein PsorP6_002377 [Peronosclerospora sorghi]|uniref:Uncharacterized protein n=1 Tax=Peronosclerospora sorghi TaxID=230839 RepID=A0ACC0WYA9_9STRA|nr:hypothetical protein PsorP6_002377 [Peronosclerospora sorghi]
MPLAADVNIQALISRSRGGNFQEAAFGPFREDIEEKVVCLRHFEAAWDQRAATPTSSTPLTVTPGIP